MVGHGLVASKACGAIPAGIRRESGQLLLVSESGRYGILPDSLFREGESHAELLIAHYDF